MAAPPRSGPGVTFQSSPVVSTPRRARAARRPSAWCRGTAAGAARREGSSASAASTSAAVGDRLRAGQLDLARHGSGGARGAARVPSWRNPCRTRRYRWLTCAVGTSPSAARRPRRRVRGRGRARRGAAPDYNVAPPTWSRRRARTARRPRTARVSGSCGLRRGDWSRPGRQDTKPGPRSSSTPGPDRDRADRVPLAPCGGGAAWSRPTAGTSGRRGRTARAGSRLHDPRGGDVVAFAGLYEFWGRDRLLTSSIVTAAGARPLAAVHDRMPLDAAALVLGALARPGPGGRAATGWFRTSGWSRPWRPAAGSGRRSGRCRQRRPGAHRAGRPPEDAAPTLF